MDLGVESTGSSFSWLELVCSLCLLLLHLGLQLVEAGSVRSKSVSSVMMRGLTSLTLATISSWMCGYCFAWSSGGPMLGTDPAYLTLTNLPASSYSHFLFYCGLASLPPVLMAASMSERVHMTGHLVLSLLLSLIIFPAAAHWSWHSQGWLLSRGCRDSGGALALHLLSGWAALLGSVVVGPRLERMGDNFREVTLPGHSLPLTGIGASLVILGMVGKVVGVNSPQVAGLVAVNSMVSGAGGCLVTMTLFKLKTRRTKKYNLTFGQNAPNISQSRISVSNRKWSFLTAFNGFLTGMICVCGAGSDLPSWAAFVTGITGGLVFFMVSGLLRLNKVDDPVHGAGVQISGGVVGALVVGLCGLAKTRDGMSVAWQVVGIVSVSAWSSASILVISLPLLLCGKLRVKDNQEKEGVDKAKMKEPSYVIGNRNVSSSDQAGQLLNRSQPCSFLQPSAGSFCHLSPVQCDGLSPRLAIKQASSYPTSTLKRPDQTAQIPELTITSCDSQAPLVSTMTTKQIRQTLIKQRNNLRNTNSVYAVREVPDENISSFNSGFSVRSSMVRQVENLASNKENFNYLTGKQKQARDVGDTDEIGDDTEIDITKYLVSPKQVQTSRNQQEDKATGDDRVVIENNNPNQIDHCDDAQNDIDQVNVIENLI